MPNGTLTTTSLLELTRHYTAQYPGSPAQAYLAHRGLAGAATRLGMGYAGHAASGHERYAGHLAIPYLRPVDPDEDVIVAALRFRCINHRCVKNPDGTWREPEHHDGHGKYQSLPGVAPMLYNTPVLVGFSRVIGIAEGELDAATATLAGVPTVGVAGASGWMDHFDPAFLGYERVFVFTDGDDAGRRFADMLAARLPRVVQIGFGPGVDVNRYVTTHGAQALRNKCGL